ncbi:hypothetical protein PFISCL1PPCAC_14259, partial [Pristionchus fissidentatus]
SAQSATVLRNVRIEPGELGAVWVTGSEDASVVLATVVDQVIEGVAVREKFVIVPVYNDTKEEMKFEKHRSIGSWKLVDGSVNGVSSEGGEESPRCRRVEAQGEDEWEAIMEKLIKNRGEAIGRELEEIHESVLVGHVGVQKLLELVEKEYVWGSMNKDVAKVVRECEVCLVNSDDYKSSMMLRMKRTKEIVNERLQGEREKMKIEYDRKREGNKVNEPRVGDRVYAFRERNGEKNPKIRICWEGPFRVVDRSDTTAKIVGIEDEKEKVVQLDKLRKVPVKREEMLKVKRMSSTNLNDGFCRVEVDKGSPLHWSHICRQCDPEMRLAGMMWKKCPAPYYDVPISNLLQLAVLHKLAAMPKMTPIRAARIINDQFTPISDKNVEEEVCTEVLQSLCEHAKRTIEAGGKYRFVVSDVREGLKEAYRAGLKEEVKRSTGYGAIIAQKGVRSIPTGRGDFALGVVPRKPIGVERAVGGVGEQGEKTQGCRSVLAKGRRKKAPTGNLEENQGDGREDCYNGADCT